MGCSTCVILQIVSTKFRIRLSVNRFVTYTPSPRLKTKRIDDQGELSIKIEWNHLTMPLYHSTPSPAWLYFFCCTLMMHDHRERLHCMKQTLSFLGANTSHYPPYKHTPQTDRHTRTHARTHVHTHTHTHTHTHLGSPPVLRMSLVPGLHTNRTSTPIHECSHRVISCHLEMSLDHPVDSHWSSSQLQANSHRGWCTHSQT